MGAGKKTIAPGSCNRLMRSDVPDQPSARPSSEPKISLARLLPAAAAGLQARGGSAGVPSFLLLFLACVAVGTVRQARDRPWDQAFAGFAYADLAALLLCVRRADQLPREPSPAGGEEGAERRCLLLAVWALSASLSCAFAYRVSLIMPAPMVVVVWSMTSFVVLLGFYLLVLCKDRRQVQQNNLAPGNGSGGYAAAGGAKRLEKRIHTVGQDQEFV